MLGFQIPVYNSRLQAFRTREGERRQTESDEILREIFVVLHSGSEITSPGSSLQPVRLQLVTCSDHPPISPASAAVYWSQVQGWHARDHGVKIAAGMKLERLPQMLKGLRRIYGESTLRERRGIAPQALKCAMDRCLDPANPYSSTVTPPRASRVCVIAIDLARVCGVVCAQARASRSPARARERRRRHQL